jgi:hypothetical protein
VNASRRLIVLTATVNPPSVTPSLVRRDVTAREADYLDSLARWTSLIRDQDHILIVENSGWEMSRLIGGRNNHVTVLSYVEESAAQARGKGVGEARMFARVAAWLRSRDLDFDQVVKATGRLRVENYDAVMKSQRPHGEHFVTCRLRYDLTQMDTRFFISDPSTFASYFADLECLVDEPAHRYLEHAAALRLSEAVFAGVHRDGFRRTPKVRGMSGSTGHAYGGVRTRAEELVAPIVRSAFRHRSL